MMMITSTPASTTPMMLCFYLFVLVVVVATATRANVVVAMATASKKAHSPPPRKPIKLKLHHRIHLDNASYESYVQARLRGERRDWVAAKEMRRRMIKQQQQQQRKNNSSSYGQELPFSMPLSNPFVEGQYVIEAGIGNPVHKYYFQVDTANLIPWLQCEPCIACYTQEDPIFDPAKSSTAFRVPNGDDLCKSLREFRQDPGPGGECEYLSGYAQGTSTKGYLIKERLILSPESDDSDITIDDIPFGCSVETSPGLSDNLAGIIALSRGPLSLVHTLGLETFSYCLPDPIDRYQLSTLILNATDPPNSSVSYSVQLLSRGKDPRVEKFFYVNLVGIGVNGVMVQGIPEGAFQLQPNTTEDTGVILDSGSDLTYFPRAVYDPLKAAFLKTTLVPVIPSPSRFYDLCFNMQNVPYARYSFPSLTYYFDNGESVLLKQRAYIDERVGPKERIRIDCFSIVPKDGLDSIIGSHQQWGNRFFFDVNNNVVKVSSDVCL